MALKRNPESLKALQVDVRDQDQFDQLLAKEGLIIVDAYAKWCGPCKAVESTFRRIRNESGDDLLHFAMAATDSIESLALYRDKSRPTFLFYGGGQLVFVVRGCDAPSLILNITRFLKEEHKILDGDSERKVFIDTEVQIPDLEEKGDVEKLPAVDEDEDVVVVEVPKEISIAIIKPDALRDGHAAAIIKNIEESGIEILHQEEKVLSKEEAAEFYKQHEGSEHFEQLIEFMSSGPVLTLVLSKKGDDAGYGLIPEVRDMLGPTDVNLAKEEAPNSLRAQYGTDTIKNAVHACDSGESAARELAFFFPDFNVPKVQEKRKKKRIQRTLALIRPDAYMQRKDAILARVEEAGFTIAMSKEMHLTREQAEEFYIEHKGKDYFESLITNMTSGPSLALCLAREDAVTTWRNMLGPKIVAQAKEEEPNSLRAVFSSENATVNQLHGAATPEEAEMELQTFFPLQSTVAVIKPDAYNEPEQKEQLVQKIKQSGFKISAQKEITLTKDLASQFYQEHEGKEFFNGLTDYMSSGPTLFLILSKEDAVSGFRALVGPTEVDSAKEQAPDSLRALFGTDTMKNAIHGSSNAEKAKAAIEEFFPEVALNPDGTVKEPPKQDSKPKDATKEGESAAAGEVQPTEEGSQQANGEQDATDDATSGEAASADAAANEVSPGDAASGDATSGEAASGDASANEAAPGDAAADATSGEAAAGDAATNEAAPGDAASNEAAPGDAVNGKDVSARAEDANNNEVTEGKPAEGTDVAGKEGEKETENVEEGKKDEGSAEQPSTTEGEKKSSEEPQSDSQANNTEMDNNGTEENNNGEDVNNETKPEENKDKNETASTEDPPKSEAVENAAEPEALQVSEDKDNKESQGEKTE